jgi:hypothetical protein
MSMRLAASLAAAQPAATRSASARRIGSVVPRPTARRSVARCPTEYDRADAGTPGTASTERGCWPDSVVGPSTMNAQARGDSLTNSSTSVPPSSATIHDVSDASPPGSAMRCVTTGAPPALVTRRLGSFAGTWSRSSDMTNHRSGRGSPSMLIDVSAATTAPLDAPPTPRTPSRMPCSFS